MDSKYIKTCCLIALVVLLVFPDLLVAQSSGGKLSIRENGFISVFGEHSFIKGSGLVPAGKILTERNGNKGYLNFVSGSSWIGASDASHVDGYVKVYHNQPFVFPIGDNNTFRPVAITGAAKSAAAYFAQDPTKMTPLNPSTPTNTKRVSNREYWDISGTTPTKIAISWNAKSNLANITGGKLEAIKIVGWKDGQWEVIPSTTKSGVSSLIFDVQQNLKVSNSFDHGVISSSEDIVPDDYTYITLGAITDEPSTQRVSSNAPVSVFPNPVKTALTVDLKDFKGTDGTISIYNMKGHLVTQKVFKQGLPDTERFDASNMQNGIYKVYVRINHQVYVSKFVVERLY